MYLRLLLPLSSIHLVRYLTGSYHWLRAHHMTTPHWVRELERLIGHLHKVKVLNLALLSWNPFWKSKTLVETNTWHTLNWAWLDIWGLLLVLLVWSVCLACSSWMAFALGLLTVEIVDISLFCWILNLKIGVYSSKALFLLLPTSCGLI